MSRRDKNKALRTEPRPPPSTTPGVDPSPTPSPVGRSLLSPVVSVSLSALGLCAGSIAASAVRQSSSLGGRVIGSLTCALIEGAGALTRFLPQGGGHVGSALRFSCAAGGSVAAATIATTAEAAGDASSIAVGLVVAALVTGTGALIVSTTQIAIAALPSTPPDAQDGLSGGSPWGNDDDDDDPLASLVDVLHDGGVCERAETVFASARVTAAYSSAPSASAPSAEPSVDDPAEESLFVVLPRVPRPPPAPYVLLPNKLAAAR
jgi:hypothetical protein